MTRKQWIILFVLIVVIIGLLIVYVYRDKIAAAIKGNGGKKGEEAQGFPLRQGSTGDAVAKLQSYLVTKDANCLPVYGVDGDWGSETQACVLKVLGKSEITYNDFKSLNLA